jgi:hypothetical protein
MMDVAHRYKRCLCGRWLLRRRFHTSGPELPRTARQWRENEGKAGALHPVAHWSQYQCPSACGAKGNLVPILRQRKPHVHEDEAFRQFAVPLVSSSSYKGKPPPLAARLEKAMPYPACIRNFGSPKGSFDTQPRVERRFLPLNPGYRICFNSNPEGVARGHNPFRVDTYAALRCSPFRTVCPGGWSVHLA